MISYEKNFRILVRLRVQSDKEIPEVTHETMKLFAHEALTSAARELPYDIKVEADFARVPIYPLVSSILDTPFTGTDEVKGIEHRVRLLQQAIRTFAKEMDHS